MEMLFVQSHQTSEALHIFDKAYHHTVVNAIKVEVFTQNVEQFLWRIEKKRYFPTIT